MLNLRPPGRRAPQPFRLSSGALLATTQVFEDYWYFAYERQEMFFRRIEGTSAPWTKDPILRAYRFTNPYRAADRVSQYLIRNVIYKGSQAKEEVFFRTLLFKLFNRIETWELLLERCGPLTWDSFDLKSMNTVLDEAVLAGSKIYSSAYMMPAPNCGASKKHTNHLYLLARMMRDRLPDQVATSASLRDVYLRLRAVHSFGDFLAFQFAIDLNYSEMLDFSEMDFVVAGPGAQSGIRKAFANLGGLSNEEIIREVTEAAEREFAQRGHRFRNLWGRPLQLVDCQNLFCEVDKYSRAAHPEIEGNGRARIKRKYLSPDHGRLHQWYPPKWALSVPDQAK
jgi:hypothetical protein